MGQALRITVSVVVPTFNRPRQLDGCLTALSRLRLPKDDFEVIVIDDGGPTPVDDVVRSYADRLKIRGFRIARGGAGAARNHGAERARGRFLAFTDDDCRPEPDWLSRLLAALDANPRALVGGRTVNRLTENPWSEASQLVIDLAYGFHNRDAQNAGFLAANNVAVETGRFREAGGFDASFRIAAEDRELCRRWRQRGDRIVYLDDAVVAHAHPLSMRSFFAQHFNYGRGAWQYHHTRSADEIQRDLRFYAELPRLLGQHVARVGLRRGCAAVALLPSWQLANTAGLAHAHAGWRVGKAIPDLGRDTAEE